MVPDDDQAPPASLSRDELIKLVASVQHGATYAESTAAGKQLASQSKLPALVAQNLGAGFGQWDFFPEVAEIVDFALAYKAPSNEDELFALAKTWASDDAHSRHTILALVGRDVLKLESRRLAVPKMVELFEETRGVRALEMRKNLGLETPPEKAGGPAASKRGGQAAQEASEVKPPAPRAPKKEFTIPAKMPKPAFVAPKKAAKAPPARRFTHPKFGEGPLEREEGVGETRKLTIKFPGGSKTLLAHFVTEVPGAVTGSPTASD